MRTAAPGFSVKKLAAGMEREYNDVTAFLAGTNWS